jgi:hypothetical protein
MFLYVILVSITVSQHALPPPLCTSCPIVLSQISAACKQQSRPVNTAQWETLGATLADCVCPRVLSKDGLNCTACILSRDPNSPGSVSFNTVANDCVGSRKTAGEYLLLAFDYKSEKSSTFKATNPSTLALLLFSLTTITVFL